MTWIAVALAVSFLVAAFFYARRYRHPDQKPLAAYLIFVTVFAIVSATIFGLTALVLAATEWMTILDRTAVGMLFVAAIVIPAFITAHRQLRKPPRPPRQP